MPPTPHRSSEQPSALRALGWAFRTYFGNARVFLVLAAAPIVIDVVYTIIAHTNGTFSAGFRANDTTIGNYENDSDSVTGSEAFFGFFMLCATFFLMTVYTRGAQLAHAGKRITRAALLSKVRWGQSLLASTVIAAVFLFVAVGMLVALQGVFLAIMDNLMHSQAFSVAPVIGTLLLVCGIICFVAMLFFMSIWYVPAAIISGDCNGITAMIRSVGLMFRYPMTTCLSVLLVGLIGFPMLLVPGGTAFFAVPIGAIAAAHTYAVLTGRGNPRPAVPESTTPPHVAGPPFRAPVRPGQHPDQPAG